MKKKKVANSAWSLELHEYFSLRQTCYFWLPWYASNLMHAAKFITQNVKENQELMRLLLFTAL